MSDTDEDEPAPGAQDEELQAGAEASGRPRDDGDSACPVCHRPLRHLADGTWYCDRCELTFQG